MIRKSAVSSDRIYRLVNQGSVVLVTASDGTSDNVFTVAWNSPVRKEPAMVSILVGKRHHSYGLIERSGAFAVHVPDASLAAAVLGCGTSSGRDIADKLTHFGLTRRQNPWGDAPFIEQVVASLACRVTQVVDMGTSALLVAHVMGAEAAEEHFRDGAWQLDRGLELLYHLGGSRFAVAGRVLDVAEKGA